VQLLRSKQKRGDGAETQDNPAAASSDGFDGERRIRNSTLSNIDEEMISSVKSSLEAVENEVLRQRNKSKLLEAKKKGSAGSASKLMFHSSDEVEHKSHGAVIRIILTVLSSAPPPFLVVAALATGDDKFYHAAVAFYPLGSQFVFLHFLITIERPSQAPGFEEKLHFWLAFWCHWGYVRRASVSGVSELGGRASERRQRPREQTSREERARRASHRCQQPREQRRTNNRRSCSARQQPSFRAPVCSLRPRPLSPLLTLPRRSVVTYVALNPSIAPIWGCVVLALFTSSPMYFVLRQVRAAVQQNHLMVGDLGEYVDEAFMTVLGILLPQVYYFLETVGSFLGEEEGANVGRNANLAVNLNLLELCLFEIAVVGTGVANIKSVICMSIPNFLKVSFVFLCCSTGEPRRRRLLARCCFRPQLTRTRRSHRHLLRRLQGEGDGDDLRLAARSLGPLHRLRDAAGAHPCQVPAAAGDHRAPQADAAGHRQERSRKGLEHRGGLQEEPGQLPAPEAARRRCERARPGDLGAEAGFECGADEGILKAAEGARGGG
jgi:hypothetical protein